MCPSIFAFPQEEMHTSNHLSGEVQTRCIDGKEKKNVHTFSFVLFVFIS